MHILLVNPWIYDFAAYDLWSKPLGLLKIAACLRQLKLKVTFVDCLDRFHSALEKFLKPKPIKINEFGSGPYYYEVIEKPSLFKSVPRRFKRYGLPKDLFIKILKSQKRPDIIFVGSGMTYWYKGVFEAIDILKQVFGSVPIILGGIYPRLCPDHAKKYSQADFVYLGNDLKEIISLIEKFSARKINFKDIPESDTLFPDYELYPNLRYVTLRTSQGCPFRCTYCGWYLLEKDFSQQDPERIINHIEDLYHRRRIKDFSFYDDALLYKSETHIVRILSGIIRRNIKIKFYTPNGLHARFITSPLALLLKKAGFVQPRLGFESISSETQRDTGGKTTNKELLRAIACLEKAGFLRAEIAVYIMAGLPGTDFKEVEETVRFLATQKVRIYLEEYSPVPGTFDYARCGLRKDDDPLLHNNFAFSYLFGDHSKLQKIKDWIHTLNNRNF